MAALCTTLIVSKVCVSAPRAQWKVNKPAFGFCSGVDRPARATPATRRGRHGHEGNPTCEPHVRPSLRSECLRYRLPT